MVILPTKNGWSSAACPEEDDEDEELLEELLVLDVLLLELDELPEATAPPQAVNNIHPNRVAPRDAKVLHLRIIIPSSLVTAYRFCY